MKRAVTRADASGDDAASGRKQFIVRTAARLFAAQGYKATTMDVLAEACAINKATLYYYYTSKADLLLDISMSVQRELQPLSALAGESPESISRLMLLTSGIVNVANSDRDAFAVYFQESAHFKQYLSEAQYAVFRDAERSMMKVVYGILNRGMYSGELIDCDVRYVGRLLVFMVLSVARWPEPQIDVERVIASITVLLSGLVKPEPA